MHFIMLILKRRWNFFLQVASHFPKTKPVTVTNVLLTCYIRITLLIQKISDLRSQDREKKSAQWKGGGERGTDGWRTEGGREGGKESYSLQNNDRSSDAWILYWAPLMS